jgi:hypothetical protein
MLIRTKTSSSKGAITKSPVVLKGLEAITARTNLSNGLTHPNDMNAAKEMFVLLHQAGELLLHGEIESYAVSHGWRAADAKELGALGAQIGTGGKPRIKDGPWWKEGLIEQWKNDGNT